MKLHLFNSKRIVTQQIKESLSGDCVIYWMDRDMRTAHNWSLVYAQNKALEYEVPLRIVYNLVPGYLGGTNRHTSFKLNILEDLVQQCQKLHMAFDVLVDNDGTQTAQLIQDYCVQYKANHLVTDFSPLRLNRHWKQSVFENITCSYSIIDAHNIVPVHHASDKREYAAYTIRPKLRKQIDEFCTTYPKLHVHPFYDDQEDLSHSWSDVVSPIKREKLDWIDATGAGARQALKYFLDNKLITYSEKRNDAGVDGQSNLSPYLHYGVLSAQEITNQVMSYFSGLVSDFLLATHQDSKLKTSQLPALQRSAGDFLEELIIRKELADNFCWHETDYDKINCFPQWAQKSHEKHKDDPREYIYTLQEFEAAATHDDLWNAAQKEMMIRAKMHGYMRMYWAKKILEWTPNVTTAMQICIYLNDKYQLDGRDPNGYAGIAWSLGGVHDRAWFERPVFGLVRYMADSGVKKKSDYKTYLETYNSTAKLF